MIKQYYIVFVILFLMLPLTNIIKGDNVLKYTPPTEFPFQKATLGFSTDSIISSNKSVSEKKTEVKEDKKKENDEGVFMRLANSVINVIIFFFAIWAAFSALFIASLGLFLLIKLFLSIYFS